MNLNEIELSKLHLQSKAVQVLIALGLAAVLVVLGYFALFKSQWEEYQEKQNKEAELKDTYKSKSIEAANLDNLQKELVLLEGSIDVLLKQLPKTEEIPSLIQELNQAGAKNGLTMNSVIPQDIVVEKPIERLPISISVTGTYNQIAQFARDIGRMSRIVTLSNISITNSSKKNGKSNGELDFSATANTYKAMNLTIEASAASSAGGAKQASSSE